MGCLPGRWDPPAWGGAWKGLLLAASVLGSCLQPAPAQSTRTPGTIVLSPPSPVVGGGVLLAPQNPPQNLVVCTWFRSATTDETGRILTYYPQAAPAEDKGPMHTGRETGGPGCALHIGELRLNDTGNYSLLMDAPGNRVLTAVFVRVSEMLPMPTVTPNHTLVPENGTFSLTCNGSSSADTCLWLRDGEPLGPSQRLVLSPDNRTLMVLNVTRGDAGVYQCEVGNAVSSNRSEPSPVTVTYGPDSTRIDPPGPILLPLGSSLTVTCVADSVPAPSYRWALNGTDTDQTGSSFTLTHTTRAQQGTYECQAHNLVTNLTAWASVAVRVMGPDPSPEPPSGLSPGAIAGIVLGSLAGAALVGGLLYFLLCRNERGPEQHNPVGGQAAPPPSHDVGDKKPTMGDQDIQYSTLAFGSGDQRPAPGPQPDRESGTLYSEIKKK